MAEEFDRTAPWNADVHGDELLPLINLDASVIRVEAGPGTGKTFGLTHRVERILHPDGLDCAGERVLVVAFNRVIAADLRTSIDRRLATSGVGNRTPRVYTIHGLCLRVLQETELRLLLPHERDAMLFDVRVMVPALRQTYTSQPRMEQALRDHEAGHAAHPALAQAVQQWLAQHRARLISDVPSLLHDHLQGGDFSDQRYDHILVDEFQDLTEHEQRLVLHLRSESCEFVALGDPRQSIYAFRGNERQGLNRLTTREELDGQTIVDIPLAGCQRCPDTIVEAANRLMINAVAEPMTPESSEEAEVHVLHWTTPQREARGMAQAIATLLDRHPDDEHLVMVTRRKFGYWLRDELHAVNPNLSVSLSFSESILEEWPVREAFLFFCLLSDPDPATWRAWFAYRNAGSAENPRAPDRNADAYLRLLQRSGSQITPGAARGLADEARNARRGAGGQNLWDRAARYTTLLNAEQWDDFSAHELIEAAFSPDRWDVDEAANSAQAQDLQLLRDKAVELFENALALGTGDEAAALRSAARELRYVIATREPFTSDPKTKLTIATMWGAKGLTADHVYVVGLCDQAIPGERTDDYPGDEAAYLDEQRRLFYVSITRARKTLVLSRADKVRRGDARKLKLRLQGSGHWMNMTMSRFLREIIDLLPQGLDGDDWTI